MDKEYQVADVKLQIPRTYPPSTTIEQFSKMYTFQEVAKHDDISSLWVVINDHVYDVTEFINEHPGGMEVFLEYAGMDATSAFEGKGHSLHAKQLLQKYYIGKLETDRRG